MNTPLFVNPHNNPYELKRIDTLNLDISRADGSDDDEPSKPVKISAIRKFEAYFAENLAIEKVERPKKRLKTEHTSTSSKIGTSTTTLPLRLLSSQKAPQPLATHKLFVPKQIGSLKIEDTAEERHERRQRAKDIAISGQTVIHGSSFSQSYRHLRKGQCDRMTTQSSLRPAVAVLVSVPNEREKEGQLLHIVAKLEKKEGVDSAKKKAKRKRFKAKTRHPRPRPSFWRPSTSMGPKASGYAMGYQGSWMVDDPSSTTYVRDRMKSGRLVGGESRPNGRTNPTQLENGPRLTWKKR